MAQLERDSAPNRINEVLRSHVEGLESWEHAEVARSLHVWAARLNGELGLRIQTPAIRIDRIKTGYLGTYRRGRNGFGLPHEITINEKHIGRTTAEVLATLLHELRHEWQYLHAKPGRHNREFRNKARSYGIVVHPRGLSSCRRTGAIHATARLLRNGHVPVV